MMNSYYRFATLIVLLLSCFPFAKANQRPKPSKIQYEWQKLETIGFIHFSINTFTDMEWGFGNESPSLLNPTNLDCRQWVKICKDAGLKGVIFTVKHHDGFCLWPSAYTEYSVKNSPWKNGKGDLVKELSEACKENDMKLGLYLSPWDCNHPDYGKPEYITYYRNQIKELLTNYGPIFEVWFDGANGGRGYYGTDSLHTRNISPDYYDWKETARIVKDLQPECIIHGGDHADIRWVGNEKGYAGQEHWSTLRTYDKFDSEPATRFQLNKGHADGTIWLPSETDVSVRPGWYYHASEDHKLKSLSQLLDIYYESVGRNSVLLLNVTPDKRGLINSNDSIRLLQWYNQYTQELSENQITHKCKIKSSSGKGVKNIADNKTSTYWSPNGTTGWIEISFPEEQLLNRLLLQENIKEGQNVSSFSVEYLKSGNWEKLADETTIGYKRLLRFPDIKTKALRVNISGAVGVPQIATLHGFYADEILSAPGIRINKDDQISILTDNPNLEIWYTVDGTMPERNKSVKYSGPFSVDMNSAIKAMVCTNSGRTSDVAERKFISSRKNWQVSHIDNKSVNAIFDEDPSTAWFSAPGKREIIIDLGDVKQINGFSYTPDQARYARGIALKYEIFLSESPDKWDSLPIKGEFSNIENNPIRQDVFFDKNYSGRYIRFTVPETVFNQNSLGIADLDFFFRD